MNRPSTAREALIVEAIGEVAALIDRVEALAPALDASRLALVQASADVAGQVVAFEKRMVAITENAKAQAIRHIARRTDELARSSLDAQTRAMEEAVRVVFRAEVGAAAPGGTAAACGRKRRPPLGALADARGDGSGGIGRHLDAGGLAVGAVTAITSVTPLATQW